MAPYVLKPFYLLPLILLSLVTGVFGGWVRLGYPAVPLVEGAAYHGLIVTGGFLGALISLERAMVMKRKFWYFAPILSGSSATAFLLGYTGSGMILLILGSAGLSLIMHMQSLKYPQLHTIMLYAGAVSWFIGNVLVWQSGLITTGTPWWIGFLLATIVGERLELSQFLPATSWSLIILKLSLVLFLGGLILPFHPWGSVLMGISSLAISVWLLLFDMAKIASRKGGQFRYIGMGLQVGYAWLGLHGLVLIGMSSHPLYYDLMLHTFFLGFVFSMVWAHAPIIFPIIFGIKETPYHPILWITWLGFQLSLSGRVVASMLGEFELRKLSGLINGYFILVQFALMAAVIFWKMWRGPNCNSPRSKEPSEKIKSTRLNSAHD